MSERFKASVNVNESKNTRLNVAEEFQNYRFGRDALAHVFRYLFVCERWIEKAKASKRPIRVLDIGCGDAYTARVFAASFVIKKTDILAEYVGFDIDEKSIARTRLTAPKSVPSKFIVGDVTTGGLKRFKDQEFDMVVNLEMLEHIQPKFVPTVLSEIARIAPEAWISTPNWTGGSGQLPEDHIKEWDTDELAYEMEKAGLAVKGRIGTFCQLIKAKKYCIEHSPSHLAIYKALQRTCPADLFSIAIARFLGKEAQNVMYHCFSSGWKSG